MYRYSFCFVMVSLSIATKSILAAEFIPLGDLPGGAFLSSAEAVSDDGLVVAGNSRSANFTEGSGESFRWEAGSMTALGALPGDDVSRSTARDMSADGSIIVGWYQYIGQGRTEGFRWESNTMTVLGYLPGALRLSAVAAGVSSDGSVIVGSSLSGNSGLTDSEAFRWEGGVMTGLGDLSGGAFNSEAYAASADGSVVVGISESSQGFEAFRWTTAAGMVGLGDLPGGDFLSAAYDVSADGSVAVGYSRSEDHGSEAFRWEDGVMTGLGVLSGQLRSMAYGISGDGSFIVGQSYAGDGVTTPAAFLWDEVHGMRSLQEVLTNEFELDLTGWQLTSAKDISSDGNFIVGEGINPSGDSEAWLVRLVAVPEPTSIGLLAFALCTCLVPCRVRRM